MIEAEANEVPSDLLKEAFKVGQKAIDASCDFQIEFLKKLTVSPKEIAYNKPSDDLIAYISNILTADKLQALTGNTKVPFNDLCSMYEKEVLELAKENIANKEQSDFTETKVKM
jgi:polyribonucleotide nucleotidyltransferase